MLMQSQFFTFQQPRLIELGKQLSCCLRLHCTINVATKHLNPIDYGAKIGVCCSNMSTISLKSGVISHRLSLTKPSRNNVINSGYMFTKKVVVLSTNCSHYCGSNVCFSQMCVMSDVHIENISVATPFFKCLYLINSNRNFDETHKAYAK